MKKQPYLTEIVTTVISKYNPDYGEKIDNLIEELIKTNKVIE